MKIIGLTGGIASGKNIVAEIFARNGAIIFDADKEVHQLLESDESVIAAVSENFPQAVFGKKIDRQILGKAVFANKEKLQILEKILHPRVRKNYKNFVKENRQKKEKLLVLNIPLLLETGHYSCDYVVAIISKRALRKERFLQREKKKNPANFAARTAELEKRFNAITRAQLSDAKRKENADFAIYNNGSKLELVGCVDRLLKKLPA